MEKNSIIQQILSDTYPTVFEVEKAASVFLAEVLRLEDCTRLPEGAPGYMSTKTLMKCACAAVWQEGRNYQKSKEKALLSAATTQQGRPKERQ